MLSVENVEHFNVSVPKEPENLTVKVTRHEKGNIKDIYFRC